MRPVWMVCKDDIKFLYWFGDKCPYVHWVFVYPAPMFVSGGIQSLVEGGLKTQDSSVGSKVFLGVTSMCYPDRPLL